MPEPIPRRRTYPGSVVKVLYARAAEMAMLDGVLTDAAGGDGRLIVLEGSAGIGKTALLEYLRQKASAHGVRVLAARASELDRAFAYGIVHQLFEPALAAAGPADRDALLSGAAGRVAALFTGTDTADEAGYATQLGLYWLTVNLTERDRCCCSWTICSGPTCPPCASSSTSVVGWTGCRWPSWPPCGRTSRRPRTTCWPR